MWGLACLKSCPLLTELTLRDLGVQVFEVPSVFFSSLQPLLIGKLKVLTLELIALNSSAAEALSHSLQSQHCSLVTLTLDHCRFLSNASTQLIFGLSRNTSLHRISFWACRLGLADVKVLTDALGDNEILKEVEIRQSFVKIDKVATQALKECNPNITFKLRAYSTSMSS